MTGDATGLHYTLVCSACGRRTGETPDGMLLACHAGHGPALLRAEYESERMPIDILAGGDEVREAVERGLTKADVESLAGLDEAAWWREVDDCLLYG